MRAIDRKVLRDLWRMRGQVLAIVLVTAVGAAMFVMSLGTLDSLRETQAAYYERYRFADIFAPVSRAPEAVAERLARIPGVKQVTTRIVQNVTLDIPGMREPINGLVVAAPQPSRNALNDVYLRRGRTVSPGATREVVLNEPFAVAQGLEPGDSFEATIKGHRRTLTVVGIGLSPEYVFFGVPGSLVPDDRRFGVLWMDRDALAAAFDLDGAFNDSSLSLMPGASEKEVIAQVDAVLLPYGGIGASGRQDQVSHAALTGEIDQLAANIQIAAPVFMGVVAFLLNMLMSRYVETERERIGVMKAFGYGNAAVAWHYAKFVLVIVALGIVVGVYAGVRLGQAVTEIYAGHYHFPFLVTELTPVVFLEALGAQLFAAMLGALGSLHRAARLPPAVAMRPAPPPVYRKTVVERVLFLLLRDQPTRMVLRHILRWPLRSGMTVLGIAGAAALLIAPMAALDSVEHMIDTHFFRAERQDLTVAFAQSRPSRSINEVQHFPGVLQVQPFRAVQTKVQFGQKSRRVTILGVQPDNELSRALDPSLRPINVPAQGIVISSSLAAWLGAGVGDYLRLEILEGRRPTLDLPVAAIAKSYVGLTFFTLHMDLSLLNRAMLDDRVITGVHLKTDPRRSDALYDQLGEVPAITGVMLHSASLESMRRLMSETFFLIGTAALVAGIIIFGVVYNSARISLVERSRELACMRMLGFSRLSVSYIMLAELVILALVALPLGSLVGYGFAWLLTEGAENELFRLPLAIRPATFGYALLVVAAAVAVSGGVVAKQISRLPLVETLKTKE